MTPREEIAALVREARKKNGLTRVELSRRLKLHGTPVHVNTLYRLESGTGRVRLWTVGVVCRVLGIPFKVGA